MNDQMNEPASSMIFFINKFGASVPVPVLVP